MNTAIGWTADDELINTPCVVDGMPDDVYHADPVEGGSLSSTGAKTILKSPALYQWRKTHRVEKTTYDLGHAAHSKILGVGLDVVAYPDEHLTPSGNVSTKAATVEWAATQRSLGLAPVTPDQMADVEAMSEAVLAHPIARALLEKAGAPEQSVFAQDPQTGVFLRTRIDRLPEPDGGVTTLVDLKTAQSADPTEFRSSAASYGYDVQSEMYQHALRLARGDEYTAFQFIVVEKTAPYLVSVVELDAEYAVIGQLRMRRAIDLYHECKTLDRWPGYPEVVHYIDAPRWLAYEEGLVL